MSRVPAARLVAASLRVHGARPSAAHLSPFLRQYFAPQLAVPRPPTYSYLTRSLHSNSPLFAPAQTPASSSSSKDVTNSSEKDKEKAVAKTAEKKGSFLSRTWAGIKKEATHYWHGTKLLGKEIRISARIQGRLLAGKKLTRREHRQLKRTTQDLLRLIPFSVFLIVPFMELLLPVALKLFPNMLPSTFTDSFKEDEKKRKLLKVRLEMAKFLQETIRETGIKSPNKIKESEAFKEFFRKVRSTGESPSTDEIVNVAKLFEDDLTLDNLSRPQLVSMCRYMNINAFGTDNFLRYTIRSRMKQLETDDKVIASEGLDALSSSELAAACQSRGIRTLGVPEEHLRSELSQWLELHINRGLSGTLLILSKAFAFNRPHGTEEGDDILRSLKDTLASLPDNLVNETELEVSSDSASYKQRLEVLQQQEELIEDEEEQEAKEAEARRTKKEAEEVAKREEAERKEAEKKEAEEAAKIEGEKEKAAEMLPADEVKDATKEEPVKEEVAPEDVRMTTEQVTELGQALEILSAKSSVLKERTELKALMDEHEKSAAEGGKPNPLAKRLKSLLEKIEKQLEDYDKEFGGHLNMFSPDHLGRIRIKDLKSALEVIRHRPSDEAIKVLLGKLDVDGDGFVPVQEIVDLAEGEGLGIVLLDEVEEMKAEAEEIKELPVTLPGDKPAPPTSPTAVTGPEASKAAVEGEKEKEKKKKKDEPKLKKEDVVEG
ncbi:MRS7 family protein [Pseudohyphozyma bogoriensis]|nr:MRS7 family protein [Pseudohyphozyma bogoriensis]